MRVRGLPAFSVQYHPEAGPGPHDSQIPVRDVRRADGRRRQARPWPEVADAKRTDIHSILIIGSGPIVIGQACEFDYSGTQACRVLREEGYRVILVNSNPATIMTDPDFADATYIEPITPEVVAKIIERERPDAVLPTLGGQTGLNTAMALYERGLIGVPGTPEMIGANAEAIATAEDREKFKQAMIEIGLAVPASGIAHTLDEAMAVVERIGLPIIIRPAYILGGRGTGIASTAAEFEVRAAEGLAASPISEILIEKSIAGWKEYELEVMRDRADNCVIICSIENVDPMGVHTGDSITVAPAQTLSDVEYQQMRDAAFACIRRVGVETGGSNVQFAVNPATGEQVVIEMNPRVSRSSALASKATGLPDRQDRRQAGRRLHARRDRERHHCHRSRVDAGQLRAEHRLRRHQDPAVGVREAARLVGSARHADAIGRRGDGDRAHVPREPAEGPALARAGPPRSRLRSGRGRARRHRRQGAAGDDRRPDARSDLPGRRAAATRCADRRDPRCVPDRSVVPRPDAADRRGARRARRASTRRA